MQPAPATPHSASGKHIFKLDESAQLSAYNAAQECARKNKITSRFFIDELLHMAALQAHMSGEKRSEYLDEAAQSMKVAVQLYKDKKKKNSRFEIEQSKGSVSEKAYEYAIDYVAYKERHVRNSETNTMMPDLEKIIKAAKASTVKT